MKWKWKPNWKVMRRRKKVALVAVALFLLLQVPFVYRRVRLGNLYSAIRPVNQERGVYRVEVYLTQLGPLVEGKPWIISNPIYVR